MANLKWFSRILKLLQLASPLLSALAPALAYWSPTFANVVDLNPGFVTDILPFTVLVSAVLALSTVVAVGVFRINSRALWVTGLVALLTAILLVLTIGLFTDMLDIDPPKTAMSFARWKLFLQGLYVAFVGSLFLSFLLPPVSFIVRRRGR